MNESQDNQLDDVLRNWARSQAVPTDDLTSFEQRIKDRMLSEHMLSAGLQPKSASAARDGDRFLQALVGIAAAILIAICGWWYLRPTGTHADFAQTASPSTDQAHILAEYQKVFGPELSWYVEQPSRSEIGLRLSGSQLSATPHDFVAIRLLLFARPASSKEWKEIQTLDVVACREEVVEVAAQSDHHSTLSLWAYPLDKKMISIDLRYEPSEFASRTSVPRGIAIESSSVQSLGELAPVSSFEREGIEYRLYQSAVLVPEKGVS